MLQLSFLRRFALLASVALVTASTARASAQVPVFVQEPEPLPESEPLPETAPALPLPAAPAAPPGTTSPPAAAPTQPAPPSAPPLAKADHIIDQRALEAAAPSSDEDESGAENYDEEGKPRRHWYGWQTLVADGASFAMLLSAAMIDSQGPGNDADTFVTIGLLGYEFAPGIIHFVHKNPGRGFASFGIRLGMPLAGAFIGAAAASGCDGFLCEVGGAAVGALFGMGGAIAIDAAVLAYDDRGRSSRRDARLVPLLVVGPRRAWVGVGGSL